MSCKAANDRAKRSLTNVVRDNLSTIDLTKAAWGFWLNHPGECRRTTRGRRPDKAENQTNEPKPKQHTGDCRYTPRIGAAEKPHKWSPRRHNTRSNRRRRTSGSTLPKGITTRKRLRYTGNG